MKTICYVDGYNLYYGCLKYSQDKWLDIYKLLDAHILHMQNPATDLVMVKFFTADIKAKVASQGQAAVDAQAAYHRALLALYPAQMAIIKGYYSLEKARLLKYQSPPDKNHRIEVWKLEEKQTDVNIALSAYRDAAMGNAEQLVFMSNDTDLAPALKAIKEDFGKKCKIGVVIPVRKRIDGQSSRPGNKMLSEYAHWTRTYITNEELSQSQLPVQIPTRKKPIGKPDYW